MSKELKPCPFCGGEAKKQAHEVKGLRAIYVVCEKCGASSGIYKTRNPRVKDEENPAIKAWNRREPIDKIVEQLEDYKMWKEFIVYDLTHRELKIITKAIEIVRGGAV